MSFKRFLNSHFVFENRNYISFLQGSSFRFAVITYCQKAKGREVRFPTVPFGHGGKTPCLMFDVISDGIYLGFYFVFYGEYSSLFIFSSR